MNSIANPKLCWENHSEQGIVALINISVIIYVFKSFILRYLSSFGQLNFQEHLAT